MKNKVEKLEDFFIEYGNPNNEGLVNFINGYKQRLKSIEHIIKPTHLLRNKTGALELLKMLKQIELVSDFNIDTTNKFGSTHTYNVKIFSIEKHKVSVILYDDKSPYSGEISDIFLDKGFSDTNFFKNVITIQKYNL